MSFTSINIIHHGRDREALLPLVYEPFKRIHGNHLLPHEEFNISRRGLEALELLTPKNETRIRRESITQYLDFEAEGANEFVYSFEEIEQALNRVWNNTGEIEPQIRGWLLNRGVTPEQLRNFRSFNQVPDLRDRIVLGIETHPYLKKWIGNEPLTGVVYPCFNHDGRPTGCHLRFLSTVPKIKFGASCPLIHVSSNHLNNQNLWLVEGIFDGLALDSLGEWYASPSSGSWSAEQLFILISTIKRHNPANIIVAHDNDRVGLKENLILFSLLKDYANIVFVRFPDGVKDVSELVFKHRLNPIDYLGLAYEEAVKRYLDKPYEPLINYDYYLGHRAEAYSNDRYNWLTEPVYKLISYVTR